MDRRQAYLLNYVFSCRDFQNNVHKNAVAAISEGTCDVCISMPFRSDRTFCFQLPTLYKNKTAVVFSPKVFVMKKEIEFLRTKQIDAALLHKSMKHKETEKVVKSVMTIPSRIRLLFATPEMNEFNYFKNLVLWLRDVGWLSYIVFDDAHYLSQLGYEHTFSYRQIDIRKYENIPKIAVTPVVTDEVIKDICWQLSLKNTKVFKLPVRRINVHYDVWFLDTISNPFEHLKNYILNAIGISNMNSCVPKLVKRNAVIYCRDGITAELLKYKLDDIGVSTLAYHNKMSSSVQRCIEKKWMAGEACVMATVYAYEFIYERPIRCIVHWTVPENIAKYYKECVQIHSKDDLAYSRIYFSTKEYVRAKSDIENYKGDPKIVRIRLNELNKMVSYCLQIKCRHAIIGSYFKGRSIPICSSNCDVCTNEAEVKSRTHELVYSEIVNEIIYSIWEANTNPKEEKKRKFKVTHRYKQNLKRKLRRKLRRNFKRKLRWKLKRLEKQLVIREKITKNVQCTSDKRISLDINKNMKKRQKKELKIVNQFGDNLNEESRRLKEEESHDSTIIQNIKDHSYKGGTIVDESGEFFAIKQFNDNLRKKKYNNDMQCVQKRHKKVKVSKKEEIINQVSLDPVETTAFMKAKSVMDELNLDKQMVYFELEPSKNEIKNEDISKSKIVINIATRNESKNSISRNNREMKLDVKKYGISRRDISETFVEESARLNKKRVATTNTCPEDYKPKRKKLEIKNKPTETEINSDAIQRSDIDSCVKNNANETMTSKNAYVEYLMNKFKLDSSVISLTLRRK